MFSLLRVPLAPRTLITVTHIRPHIRRFASQFPPDGSSQVPALFSKQSSKVTPNHEHDSDEHELEHEPHSQPQPELESQQSVPEDPAAFDEYDKNHEDYRPLRPPHGIEIDKERHGLSRFYRKFRQTNLEGEVWEWAPVELKDHGKGHTGRSLIPSVWSCACRRFNTFPLTLP